MRWPIRQAIRQQVVHFDALWRFVMHFNDSEESLLRFAHQLITALRCVVGALGRDRIWCREPESNRHGLATAGF